ncbi:MAG: hypothetical protein LBS91_03400 [Clostridiales Family XIII bacterium]|jgi:hypothetical protein|nr:hypothetical protein [Clostridiales Family XIII bacterium]
MNKQDRDSIWWEIRQSVLQKADQEQRKAFGKGLVVSTAAAAITAAAVTLLMTAGRGW